LKQRQWTLMLITITSS